MNQSKYTNKLKDKCISCRLGIYKLNFKFFKNFNSFILSETNSIKKIILLIK